MKRKSTTLLLTGLIFAVLGGLALVAFFGKWVEVAPQNEGIFLTISTIVMALGIGAIILGNDARSKEIRETPQVAEGTSLGQYVSDQPQTREMDGAGYTVTYNAPITGKHAQPSKFRVTVPVDLRGEFEIVPETYFDQIAKSWGLTREIETLDESFDKKFFVRTDDIDFTRTLLEYPDNRLIITEVIRMGFNKVSLKNRELVAEWSGFDPKENDTPTLSEDVAARLILMSRKLPPGLPDANPMGNLRRVLAQFLLWPLMVGYPLLAISALYYAPVSEGTLALWTILFTILTFPLAAIGSAWFLRGSSRSHLVWGKLMLFGLGAIPIGSCGLTMVLNATLDSAEPTVHRAEIVNKYSRKARRSYSYHVEVKSWRQEGAIESFRVRGSDYGGIVTGVSDLLVTTGPGFLGMEWVQKKEVDAKPAK